MYTIDIIKFLDLYPVLIDNYNMLVLPPRKGEKLDFFNPLMKSIDERVGPQVAEMLKPTLSQMQTIRNNLVQVTKFCIDSKMIEKLIADSKLYLSIWNSICQNFVFGKEKDNVNILFMWYDTYKSENRSTTQPIEERLSILFNLGTLYNEMGVKLVDTIGDHFKDANNCFLTASWIFDKVRMEVASHKIFSAGTDLTEQNLSMYIYITNAQSIYCTEERLKSTMPDRYGLLAKLAKQAANCYNIAYSYSTTQPISQHANSKGFANVLQVNERINMAKAYYWASMDQHAKCEKTGVGMGRAVANIRKANEYLNMLRGLEKNMNPIMLTNYKTLKDLYAKTQESLEKKNNKVHFDPVPPKPDDIDLTPLNKPISIEQELTQPFEGQAILARMVPLPVQELEEEYKTSIRKIINEAFDLTSKIETTQAEFLTKRNLPAALHAVSIEEELPEDLWQKINQCKMQCTTLQLTELIAEATKLGDNNTTSLQKLSADLDKEELQDKEMKEKYDDKWTRQPSAELNGTIRKQLEYYTQKCIQGKESDAKVKSIIELNLKQLEKIEWDKEDLIAAIPRSANASKFLSPTAIKYFTIQQID